MALIMPFISNPLGGIPPADTAVIVSGGNPSVHDAAPGVIGICEGTGIVFLLPPAAKASTSFDGALARIIR
jgi:hypothetical protein